MYECTIIAKDNINFKSKAFECTLINNIQEFKSYTEYNTNDDIYIEEIQKILLLHKIKLYLLKTNKINEKNYKSINTINLANLQYSCKFISIAYFMTMLLDVINFMVECIDIQKNISKWIKIVPIFIFIRNQKNQIICGYLMNYVEGEQIKCVIKDEFYWEHNRKKINSKVISLLNSLTRNKIMTYDLNYENLIWNRYLNELYYTGIEFNYFQHPSYSNEDDDIKTNNDLIKESLMLLNDESQDFIDLIISCIYSDRKS